MILRERLGFGCVALSTLGTARRCRDLLEAVFDLGIRHFDTAPIYGRGCSERLLGDFLRDKRDRATVATKFGRSFAPVSLPVSLALPLNALRRRMNALGQSQQPAPEEFLNLAAKVAGASRPRITRATLEQAFDASRRALRSDYVDFYLLHENVPASLEPSAVDFLKELKADGRVRKIGLAANGGRYMTLSPDNIAEWDVLQYEFGPTWPEHASLRRRFPDQMHIYHSCLKGVVGRDADGGSKAPGRVLAECLLANPSGKVLFSSTRLAHIRENLRVLASDGGHAIS